MTQRREDAEGEKKAVCLGRCEDRGAESAERDRGAAGILNAEAPNTKATRRGGTI